MAFTTPRSAICNCGSGQEISAVLAVAEGRPLGAVGKIGADLAELRIGAEGVEARHGQVELAAERAHELVARSGLRIERRRVGGDDLRRDRR